MTTTTVTSAYKRPKSAALRTVARQLPQKLVPIQPATEDKPPTRITVQPPQMTVANLLPRTLVPIQLPKTASIQLPVNKSITQPVIPQYRLPNPPKTIPIQPPLANCTRQTPSSKIESSAHHRSGHHRLREESCDRVVLGRTLSGNQPGGVQAPVARVPSPSNVSTEHRQMSAALPGTSQTATPLPNPVNAYSPNPSRRARKQYDLKSHC